MGSSIVGNSDATSQPLVDAALGDLQRKVEGLSGATSTDKSSGALDIEIASVVGYQPAEDGLVTPMFRYLFSGDVRKIKTIVVRRDRIVTAADYDALRIKDAGSDLTTAHLAAGQADLPFVPLKPNKTFDVIRLVAFDSDGLSVENPLTEPTFAGYPANALLSFTTPSAANAPSAPRADRVVINQLDPNTEGSTASVTLRVYANEAQTLTFSAQATDAIQVKLIKDSDGSVVKRVVNIDDPSQLFIDVQVGDLQVGRRYTWTKNTAFSGSATIDATGSVAIFAGGFADPSDGLAGLTLVSITFNNSDPFSSSRILLRYTLHQPSPPYALKNSSLDLKKATEDPSLFRPAADLLSLHDPQYNVAGNIVIEQAVDVRPTKTYNFRRTVKAIEGVTKQFTSGDISPGTETLAAAALTASQGGPSYIDGGGLIASQFDYDGVSSAQAPGNRWDTSTNSGTNINNQVAGTLASHGIQWRDTEARLLLNTDIVTKGGKPAALIGKNVIAPGQDWCGSFLIICDSVDITLSGITMALRDQTAGDISTTHITSIPVSSTVYRPFFFIFVGNTSYVRSGKQWLEIRLDSNPAQKVYVTQFQLEPGIAFHAWKMNANEQQVVGALAPTSQGEGSATTVDIRVLSSDGSEYSRGGVQGGIVTL